MIVLNKDLNDETLKSLTELLDKDISPKSAFQLLKISSVLEELVNNKNKVQSKILQKYGENDPNNPSQVLIQKDKVDDFKREMEELMSIKHDIDIDPIKIEDLNLKDNIKTKTLGVLKFLFDIDLPTVKSSDLVDP